MINAEKLLGGLLGGSTGSGLGSLLSTTDNLGGLSGATVGMGLLGVAVAAFEHFSEQNSSRAPMGQAGYPPMAPPTPPGATPPPPPATGGMPGSPAGAVPPPAPGMAMPTPPMQPCAPAAMPPAQADPMLLIRAMIASANADGVLDDMERMRILGQLEGVGLSEEEKDFLCGEFNQPWPLQQIAAAVTSPAVAAQVFMVSLMAVDVDTDEERVYLETLRQALGLDAAVVQGIAKRLGKQI